MGGIVWTVVSGKGGVGKTTITANLGAGLAQEGARCVVVDADIGLRNLDIILGLENRIVYDMVDVVEGLCRLKQALIRDKRYENLYLLPAAQTRTKNAISEEQMIAIIDELRLLFDYIIIDGPAGIEHGFQNAVCACDEIILVTVPEVTAVRDADRIIGLLGRRGMKPPWLLANRVRVNMVASRDMMGIKDLTDILGIEAIGSIPDDEEIIKSANIGLPVVSGNSLAALAFRDTVKRMMGADIPVTDAPLPAQIKTGIFKRIAGFLSGKKKPAAKYIEK